MAFVQHDKLAAGELISASFTELAENRRAVLIYLGVFVVVGLVGSSLATALAPIAGLGGLALFVGYFLAQYLLYRSVLRRAGQLIADDRIRIFRFMAMAVVIAITMTFAMYLFVIPAILIGARWIVAPCYMVATNKGLFASLGDSWSATSGNTLPLALAFTALFLVFMVLFVVVGTVDTALRDLAGANLATGVGVHFLPLLLMGLSVAAYRRLSDDAQSLSEVFA
jgi:hypothetical protein